MEREKADTLLNDIVVAIAKIQETAKARASAPIPPEYLESLRLDAELLASAAAGASNSSAARKRMFEILRSVAEDLEAKVVFSEKLLGAGLRLVEFVVHTQKDGVESGGYEVWYVPRGWSDTPDKFRRSDQLSSPAIMNLAPGNYLVWLKKGDVATEKVTYTLGKDGSRKEIVFPIP